MNITYNKRTALRILRSLRCDRRINVASLNRIGLVKPDCTPRKRWTKSLFDLSHFNIDLTQEEPFELDVAVPDQAARLKTAGVANTVYAPGAGLPRDSFLNLGHGVAIPSPELLFVELADQMSIAEHVMLGYELCGSFSRNPIDPRTGKGVIGVAPVTSTVRLRHYLDACKWVRGLETAQITVEMLSDNAWAPTEAVIGTMFNLPVGACGYGLGKCIMNKRFSTADLRTAASKGSRVPDILIQGTNVGANYDGVVHLDLDSVASAGVALGKNPDDDKALYMLEMAMHDVRAKVIDDLRRTRELAALGYTVVPVTKEDLYEPGGLDNVVRMLLMTLDRERPGAYKAQFRALDNPRIAKKRFELLMSLMPGKQEVAQHWLFATPAGQNRPAFSIIGI